jgi:hypothetical protein
MPEVLLLTTEPARRSGARRSNSLRLVARSSITASQIQSWSANRGEVLDEAAGGDPPCCRGIAEHWRAAFGHPCQGLCPRLAGDVEQQDPTTGLGAERRDAAAHRAGAEHRDRIDLPRHRRLPLTSPRGR